MPDANTHADRRQSDTNGDADTDVNTYSHGRGYSNSHIYSDAHGDCNRNANSYGYADSGNAYTYADLHARRIPRVDRLCGWWRAHDPARSATGRAWHRRC